MVFKTHFSLGCVYRNGHDDPQPGKIQLPKSSAYLLLILNIVLVQQSLNTGTIVRMNISEVFHLNRKREQKRQQEFFLHFQWIF